MSRFVIVVLDGFGVGAMDDVPSARPGDKGADTFLHIFKHFPNLRLPTLFGLGLLRIDPVGLGWGIDPHASWGKSELAHQGADTFFGHQEIMGTKPHPPFCEPIKKRLAAIKAGLEAAGHKVRVLAMEGGGRFLVVDEALTVADNIECDPGQAFNVTATLDRISFEDELEIGRIVRGLTKVPRVITFGGRDVAIEEILAAAEQHGEFVGVDAPKSGVYRTDYHCVHLGYGVDPEVQAATIIGRGGTPVFMLGKAADVIQNPCGRSFSMVPTREVLETTRRILSSEAEAFVCANVQETDLAGHREDAALYKDVLIEADEGIGRLLPLLGEDDILVVMADHGNDPYIGHPRHTRECVPLMVYSKGTAGRPLGTRKTLSDVGATACDFFGAGRPQNGGSFLGLLKRGQNEIL